MVRIALSGQTRKALALRLQQAYAAHATRLIRRAHALLWLGDGDEGRVLLSQQAPGVAEPHPAAADDAHSEPVRSLWPISLRWRWLGPSRCPSRAP